MRVIVFSLLLVLSSISYGYAKPSAIEQTTQVNAKNNPIDELTNAVLENDQGKVKSILDNNRNLINNKNSEGKYPLEMTLILENCEMAELLLNYGAYANAKTSSGETIYQLVMKSENKALKKIFAKSKSKN